MPLRYLVKRDNAKLRDRNDQLQEQIFELRDDVGQVKENLKAEQTARGWLTQYLETVLQA